MKSKTTAALLAFFLGGFGAHHFYLGNNTRGVVYLALFFIGLWLWIPLIVVCILSLIDFISYLCKSEDDFNLQYNSNISNTSTYNAYQQSPAQNNQSAFYNSNANQSTKPNDSFEAKTEKLKQLKELLDSGAITQEEFTKMKQEILNN